jgi:hypothetical protein
MSWQTATIAPADADTAIHVAPGHHDPALAAIIHALEAPVDAISSHRDIPDAAGLARRARELAAEVKKPRPERGRIQGLLALLSAGTRPAGDLAFSVATLKAAMFGLPGLD